MPRALETGNAALAARELTALVDKAPPAPAERFRYDFLEARLHEQAAEFARRAGRLRARQPRQLDPGRLCSRRRSALPLGAGACQRGRGAPFADPRRCAGSSSQVAGVGGGRAPKRRASDRDRRLRSRDRGARRWQRSRPERAAPRDDVARTEPGRRSAHAAAAESAEASRARAKTNSAQRAPR